MERFVLLPFSSGCVSHSSIATCDQQSRKSMKPDATPSPKGTHKDEEEEDGRELGEENIKNSSRILSLPKASIATSLQKLLKHVKTLSQIFAYRDEMEDEEEETEMQIGNPTDVKHVTHIGWNDSLAITNNLNSWDTFLHPTAPELDISLLCNHQNADP